MMSAPVTGPLGIPHPIDRPDQLRLWSFAMLPGFVVGSIVAIAIGARLMSMLGVPEGQLLTAAGFYGWLAGALVTSIMCVAPLLGLRYAWLSQRLRPTSAAQVALCLNGAALLYVVVTTSLNWVLPTS